MRKEIIKGASVFMMCLCILNCGGKKSNKIEESMDGLKKNINKNVNDTVKYSVTAKGNKLLGMNSYNKNKLFITGADKVDNYLAESFIFHANNGVLMEIENAGVKKFFNTYDIPVSTFKILKANSPSNSVGLQFRFVELKEDYNIIKKQTSSTNFLYMILIPVKEDEMPAASDKNYVVFNLSQNFDINTSLLNDSIYKKIQDDYTEINSDIYKSLTNYYSHNKLGNTKSIFYSWEDIEKNINLVSNDLKSDSIKFKLAEIIDINSILFHISKFPQLSPFKQQYESAYRGREKQLTIVGEFYNKSVGTGYYFDMGELRP